MTARDLTQRRCIPLFTMLTVLTFRYPSGHEPALIPALRSWLGGWPGEGWRATFFPEGRGHSLTAAVGSA